MDADDDWPAYFAMLKGRPPREHLRAALASVGDPGTAVDLGAGDGVDSRYLLGLGWRVVAIDATPGIRERVLEGAAGDASDRLDARDAHFRQVETLPRADLVFASYSLPFTTAAEFAHIWQVLTVALGGEGVFAGQLFGDRDDWAGRSGVTTHSAADVAALLQGWRIVTIAERESDGPSGSGPKHWHVFDIIARPPRV